MNNIAGSKKCFYHKMDFASINATIKMKMIYICNRTQHLVWIWDGVEGLNCTVR